MAIAESGGESLDLGLDARRHVFGRSVGHVAVRPTGVLAGRRPRRIEQALLRQQHKGLLGDLAPTHGGLGVGELLQRSREVYRAGSRAVLRTPGNRGVERPIDLEDPGPVLVPLQRPAVSRA